MLISVTKFAGNLR